MAINLSSTLPAAPAGHVNVTWQEDPSGDVSAYVVDSSAAAVTSIFGRTGDVSSAVDDYVFTDIGGTATLAQIPVLPESQITNLVTDLAAKAATSSLAPVALSGAYADLTGSPTIPAAQVQSDWTAVSGLGIILHQPTLVASATTDTTNATNITSGTLGHGRLPALLSADIPNNTANTTGNAATATNVPYSGLTGTVTTWNQNTTGTAAGLSANITESQVTNLVTDLAAKASTAVFTSTVNGLTPLSGGGTVKYLRADGTFAIPPGTASLADPGANGLLKRTSLNVTAVATGADIPNIASTQVTGLATVATTGVYTDLTGRPAIPAAQVQSDWTSVTSPSSILNKPVIPATQVNSDWTAVSGLAQILNKPVLVASATTDTTNATNITGGTLSPARMAVFTAIANGLTPLSGGGTANFLRADGTWTAPAGAGTVSTLSVGNLSPLFTASVATATSTPAVTFALSAAAQNSVLAGPVTGGAGSPSFQTAPTISAANMTAFPTFNQNTTGTAAGLSANIAESQVTSLTTDLAAKVATSTLAALSTGILKVTTGTGALTIAAATDFPVATVGTLGVVKVDGTTIFISGAGVLSATPDNALLSQNNAFTGTNSFSLGIASGGALSISGSAGLPASLANTLWIAGGFSSPVAGKIYVGDGSGWHLTFARRTSSTDAEVASISDQGVIKATAATLNSVVVTALTTPVNSAFSTATTGGTMVAGTYYYRVAATDSVGITLASTETSQVVPAGTSTNTVTVNWGAVAGAANYKVYGRTTGAELAMVTAGPGTLTWLDTGSNTPSGALPTANTTGAATVAGLLTTNQAIFNSGMFTPSIANPTTSANSFISLNTTGSVISRNVADANPVLQIKNLNATSTGDFLDCINQATTTVAKIDYLGNLTANGWGSFAGTHPPIPTISGMQFGSAGSTYGGYMSWNYMGAPTDQKFWDVFQDPTSLYFRTINDAITNNQIWMTVTRSGFAVSSINLAATTVSITGALTATSINASALPLATTSAFGAVKPDGTTVTISAGVISAVGTGASLSANNTWTGTNTISTAGAASTSVVSMTGALFTGGTGTTTEPMWQIQPSTATNETGWNTAGTFLGINSATGFTGNFLDFHVNNGASVFKVDYQGNITTTGTITGTMTQATTSVFGVVKPDGTTITIAAGVISSTGGVSLSGTNTWTGVNTISTSAAANTPALSITGNKFGGTGTTSTPLVYINNGATAPTDWVTGGTYLGINAVAGFGGNFMQFHINGAASLIDITAGGNIYLNATTGVVNAPVGTFNHHTSGGAAPGIVASTGAGTGPTVSLSGVATDTSGVINVTTGTTPAGSGATIVNVTFAKTFGTNAKILLTPVNAAAAALTGAAQVFVPFTGSGTGFTLTAGTTALAATTAYMWQYFVIN
jgi:hypothetical protein